MIHHVTDTVTLRHGAQLTSRIAMAPMQTHSGKRGGFVSEDTIRYYEARSQAASLLISEFHYVSENGDQLMSQVTQSNLGLIQMST